MALHPNTLTHTLFFCLMGSTMFRTAKIQAKEGKEEEKGLLFAGELQEKVRAGS